MLIINLVLFLCIISLITLGSVVLLSGSQKQTNRFLAFFTFSTSGWLAINLLTNLSSNQTVALFFARLTMPLSMLVPFFYYLFILKLFNKRVKKWYFGLISTAMLILLIATPTSYNIASIDPYGLNTNTGIAYYLLVIFSIMCIVPSVRILIKEYFNTNLHTVREQIKYIFLGFMAAFIPVLFFNGINTLFWSSDILILVGPAATIFLPFFTTYAVFKHSLFDIRLVVVRSLGYVLSLGLILAVSAFMLFGFSAQLVRWGVSQEVRLWSYVLFTLVLALSYPPIKRFFDKLTNKLFYRDAYDTQELMNEFNQVIVSTIDLPELLKRSSAVIAKYLKPDFCDIAVRSSEDDTVRIISDQPVKLHKEALEQIRGYVHKAEQRVLVTDVLEEAQDELKQLLQKSDIGMLVRVTGDVKVEGSGYIVLGYKKSGNMYSTQDTAAIEIVANELAIAIQNALQFEEIQKFNVTLQEKIDDATKKLKKTNEKLKAMDETKDEFISMASHQLRTPLTSVKGYLSMVLEGDAGEVSEMQQKLLNQAFISSQRMVYLIADLLNVSRLRTGKFIIEALPTSLADVVEGEVGQLVETAKSRGLELSYEKPAEFTSLMLDETKVRQVVMNFIDNAIYYTPKGGHIVARVEDKPDSVEFTVSDDGMGVPKSEQPHLFSKFYRAGNAKKARPDGTGLGLFMAKKVIVAQGGSILFRSTEGKGSTFGFTFPKAKLLPPEAAATDL
jgi:signal transduction histidine kinase